MLVSKWLGMTKSKAVAYQWKASRMPGCIFTWCLERNAVSVSPCRPSLYHPSPQELCLWVSCLPPGFRQPRTAAGGWGVRGEWGTHSPESSLPRNSLVVVLKATAPVQWLSPMATAFSLQFPVTPSPCAFRPKGGNICPHLWVLVGFPLPL